MKTPPVKEVELICPACYASINPIPERAAQAFYATEIELVDAEGFLWCEFCGSVCVEVKYLVPVYFDGTHLAAPKENLWRLHKIAQRAGLKKEWFQDHDKHPHYDVLSGEMKARAVACGALQVDSKTLVKRCKST